MRVNYCTENGIYILQLGAVNLNVDITVIWPQNCEM